MGNDVIIILSFSFILITIFVVALWYTKRKKNKEPQIVRLQVVEQEVDVDKRFLLIAIYDTGKQVILNKDKPLDLISMEKYFESELERLCTK